MKIVVIGGTSLLGRYFLNTLGSDFEILAVQRRSFSEAGDPSLDERCRLVRCDCLSRPDEIRANITGATWLINFISDGRVDACENNPKASEQINLQFPLALARHCETHGIKTVNFSSNVVFDGLKAPYCETDTLSPQGVYGAYKAEVERQLGHSEQHLVIRTLSTYGIPFPNHYRTNPVFHLMTHRPETRVRAVTDVFNNPVYAQDIANFLVMAIRKNLAGIYNVAGADRLSRYQLFEYVFRACRYDLKLLTAARDRDFPGLPRPPDSTLLTDKAVAAGWRPGHIEQDIKDMLEDVGSTKIS